MVTWIDLVDEEEQAAITQFSGEYYFLSNFYPSTVELEGQIYSTVEHAYQAAKTKDKKERIEIQRAFYPAEAKRLGRAATIRSNWDDVKLDVMRYLLEQKFAFGRIECVKLCNTLNTELVEGNTWGDTYWGVCDGEGANHLGKLLMEIREDRLSHSIYSDS